MGAPAEAAHCPYGQIWRIHLGECLSWHDARARAYATVGVTRRWRLLPLAPVTPPIRIDPPPPEPIVDTQTPILIPELLVGMPPRWFICAKHPEWCLSTERKPTE
jgi:hypothetical protein